MQNIQLQVHVSHTNEETDTLETLLRSVEISSVVHNKPAVAFSELLKSFDAMQRMPLATDPLKYWKTKQNDHPEMYLLAKILFTVPAHMQKVV